MTVKFQVPVNLLAEELFFLIGVDWLQKSDDCKFDVAINDKVVDALPLQLTDDPDAGEIYHV